MKRLVSILMIVVGLFGLSLGLLADETHPQGQPLRLGFDMGNRPFQYWDESGTVPMGLGIDISEEIAQRLGRPGIEIVDVNWSGIFAGLFAEQYEAIFFLVNIKQERTEFLDFTEPFMTGGYAVLCRLSDKPTLTSIEAFDGLKLGSNAGSNANQWAIEHADEYGFSVMTYDKYDDAVLALMTAKIDGMLSEFGPVAAWVGAHPDELAVGFKIGTQTDWGTGEEGYGMAFNVGDSFRDDVERVIEGMKLDGTLQALIAPYFGVLPTMDYANLVFPGYGTPGLISGYEPEAYHVPFFPEH